MEEIRGWEDVAHDGGTYADHEHVLVTDACQSPEPPAQVLHIYEPAKLVSRTAHYARRWSFLAELGFSLACVDLCIMLFNSPSNEI